MSSTVDEDIRIFSSLIKHIGLDPLVFLIQVEQQLATVPHHVFPLSQRTDHITHLINARFQTNFSVQKVRVIRNEIDMNQGFINRLTPISNFNEFIRSYVGSHASVTFIHRHFLNELILLPFTKYCINCKSEIIKFSSNSINVLDIWSVKPACIIEGHCLPCHLSFSISSMESTNFATRYYSSCSINNSNIFYIGGALAFSHSLLNLFTSLLINCHCTFLGFATTIIDMISQNDESQKDIFNVDSLAKRFENGWLSYQLAHFELMLGKSNHVHQLVAMPRSMQPDSRDLYFEQSASYWYHLFVVFWSRHKSISSLCDPESCSKCIVTDGDQKPRRLICHAHDIVDTAIPEMGPVVIGCPYPPVRQTNAASNGWFGCRSN